ncbi:MAG: molybdopterin dinucleotide binding domain-containing protein, partial [Nitrospinota bacterium]
VRALLVAGTDPLFDHPRAAEFAEAVGRVPLVVAFSSLPGPLVQKAHIVLPEANFLERWTEDTLTHIGGFSVFSVGRPAVRDKEAPPALEDIFFRVAKKIGGPVAESFGWDAFTDAIFEAAVPLAEAGRGYVVSDPVHERFRTILSRQGYWQKEVEDADELWEKLLVNGAWWDPGDEEGGAEAQILHRGRKFQFFPERLKQILSSLDSRSRRRAVRSLGLMDGEGPPFPADPPRPKEKPGELELVLFRPLALFGPAAAELPWLQEQLGPHVGARWDSWVEIHPREAERLGLHPGDRVELSAGGKKLRTRVRTFEGVPPGTAAMPLGLGRGEAGRWAKDRGADPRRILRIEADPIGGTGVLPPARVRIRRVG